jgi:hypothetical protein
MKKRKVLQIGQQVRNEVEHINRKFWDTLEMTLKKSIVADLDEVSR